jgi:hypothetical protein
MRENGVQPAALTVLQMTQDIPAPLLEDARQPPTEIVWGHSLHMIDFVKAVVRDGTSRLTRPEASQALLSLQKLLHTLEAPHQVRKLRSSREEMTAPRDDTIMPPQESAVAVLRWAKGLVRTYNLRPSTDQQ